MRPLLISALRLQHSIRKCLQQHESSYEVSLLNPRYSSHRPKTRILSIPRMSYIGMRIINDCRIILLPHPNEFASSLRAIIRWHQFTFLRDNNQGSRRTRSLPFTPGLAHDVTIPGVRDRDSGSALISISTCRTQYLAQSPLYTEGHL
jgi:hypothetical protein